MRLSKKLRDNSSKHESESDPNSTPAAAELKETVSISEAITFITKKILLPGRNQEMKPTR